MNLSDFTPFSMVVIAGSGLVLLVAGVLIGRASAGGSRKKPGTGSDGLPVVEEREIDDVDEPTAPIAPMVEMSASPHDRHRDLTIGRALVRRIDFLDSMIRNAGKKGEGELEEQLRILRKDFFSLLRECSVEPFSFDAGTIVTTEVRKEIQVVDGRSKDGERTRIAETVLCGFRYLHGDEDTMILRKAEVVIG